MKHIYKIILLLFSFAFQVLGVMQLGSTSTAQDIVGINAATFLFAHGITTLVFGAILLFIAMGIFVLVIVIYVREVHGKGVVVPQPKPSSTIKRLEKWAAHMEKTFGPDWMNKLDAIASAINPDKKK